MIIDIDSIQESIENNDGFCVKCKDITNLGGVEPDAEKYPCDECNSNSVMGIETALLMGELQ